MLCYLSYDYFTGDRQTDSHTQNSRDAIASKKSFFSPESYNTVSCTNNDGRCPYRDSVGNRVLVHLKVLLYPLGVVLTLN